MTTNSQQQLQKHPKDDQDIAISRQEFHYSEYAKELSANVTAVGKQKVEVRRLIEA